MSEYVGLIEIFCIVFVVIFVLCMEIVKSTNSIVSLTKEVVALRAELRTMKGIHYESRASNEI